MTASKDQSAPLVVVVGSTGTQGGSVIQELIKSDRPYRIRGLTRDPTKPAGKKLEEQGVETFKVDINAGNAEGITAAFTGAEVVFAVTNFWEHMSLEKEVNDGKAIADAAKKVGVKLLVWSSLPHVAEISGGKYTAVAHFDGKALIAKYIHEIGVPTVEVQAGFYASNLAGLPLINKGPDGSLTLRLITPSDTLHPVTDIPTDYGLFVVNAIENNRVGTVVHTFSELVSATDMCTQFEEVTGMKITKTTMSLAEFNASAQKAGAPPHIAQELTEMYQFFGDHGYYAKSGEELIAEKKALNLSRPTITFKEYIKSQDWSAFSAQ